MFKMSQSTNSLHGSVMNLSRNPADEDQDKRKLIKLHWREAQVPFASITTAPVVPVSRYSTAPPPPPPQDESIWSLLNHIEIDKEKLAHLFELKQAEVKTKVS